MGTLLTSCDSWVPKDIKLETAALEIAKGAQNTLVIAGPGAGKTELLAQRACFLLQTNSCSYPKRILAVSFKKDAASNLSERIEKRCGKELAGRFESMTFDSFAKTILDRFYNVLPEKYRPNPDYLVDTNNALLQRAFSLAGYYNMRLNSRDAKPQIPSKVMQMMLHGDPENDFRPALTFNLISRLSNYLLIENELLVRAIQATYSHVFLDEFQDTTTIQYELVKTCFQNSGTILTAVGDSKQRIMMWAGAIPNVFEQYINDFSAKEELLLMNHRSAPKLITLQKCLYEDLNETVVDIIPNQRWKEDDGLAELHYFNNQIDESEFIRSTIKDLLAEGVRPNDICILVKMLPDQYANSLIGAIPDTQISIRNEVIYQDLLKEDLTKIIIATLYCSLKTDDPRTYIYLQDIELLLKSIDIDEIEKYNLQLQKLSMFLNSIQQAFEGIDGISYDKFNKFAELINNVTIYFGEKEIKNSFLQYQNADYFEEIKKKIIELLWQDYIYYLDWEKAINSFNGEYSIPVMTIHKSKGLEFDTTFFLGLEDNAFSSFASQKQEDTCTFFVAISRAKRNLYFTTSAERTTLIRNSGKQSITNIKPLYNTLHKSQIVKTENHIN